MHIDWLSAIILSGSSYCRCNDPWTYKLKIIRNPNYYPVIIDYSHIDKYMDKKMSYYERVAYCLGFNYSGSSLDFDGSTFINRSY